MKKILFIILISYLFLTNKTYASFEESIKEVKQKKATILYNRDLDNRAKEKAKYFNIPFSDNRISIIRNIISTFPNDSDVALAVAYAESKFRCNAVNINTNGTIDRGPFQINSVHKKRGNLEDCKENIKIAKQIVDEQGWNPWVTYWKKIYINYL